MRRKIGQSARPWVESDIEHAGEHRRLIGHDAHGVPFHSGKAGDDVLCMGFLDLEKVALVHRLIDQLLHVIGLVRVGRDQRVQRGVDAFAIVLRRYGRRIGEVRSRRKLISRRICNSASTSLS